MYLETKLHTEMEHVSLVRAGKELCSPNAPIQSAGVNRTNEDWKVSIRDVQGIRDASASVTLSEKSL